MKKVLQQSVRKAIHKKSHYSKGVVYGLMVLIGLPILTYVLLIMVYKGRIYPRISIAGLGVSHQRQSDVWQAVDILQQDYLSQKSLKFENNPNSLASMSATLDEITLDSLELRFDSKKTVDQAYQFGRNRDFLTNIKQQIVGLLYGKEFKHRYTLDPETLDTTVKSLAESIDLPGIDPTISIVTQSNNTNVEISAGEDGLIVDQTTLKLLIHQHFENLLLEPIKLPIIKKNNKASPAQIQTARQRAESIINKHLTISLDSSEVNSTWQLPGAELINFISFKTDFDQEKITTYVQGLAESINRPAQNATFKFDGVKVVEFAPSKSGIKVDITQTVASIITSLSTLEATDSATGKVIVQELPAQIHTDQANDLGIKELLGAGESTYKGSIPGRIHNVALTASKLHGVLVPPGAEFSFNTTVGEVSRATGYQTAYVIQDGRTVLGDGGGVCQDSTTLFRALLDAGLPITQRKAHSYRVGYYEQNTQPGYDATVFAPTADLKFVNDTPANILIQVTVDTKNTYLKVELYGTKDGRQAVISNYKKWGAVPAPPPLYQDDPTLPTGTIKQIDWEAAGLKVTFDYTVTRNGETVFEKTFLSNYRPWQAVYLKGTQ